MTVCLLRSDHSWVSRQGQSAHADLLLNLTEIVFSRGEQGAGGLRRHYPASSEKGNALTMQVLVRVDNGRSLKFISLRLENSLRFAPGGGFCTGGDICLGLSFAELIGCW